jgi:glutamine synthetase
MLGAGLHGIKNNWSLPPETKKMGRDLIPADIGTVPRSLLEAADYLARSKAARQIFGDKYVEHCVACCVHEDEFMRSHVSSFERQRYLFHV